LDTESGRCTAQLAEKGGRLDGGESRRPGICSAAFWEEEGERAYEVNASQPPTRRGCAGGNVRQPVASTNGTHARDLHRQPLHHPTLPCAGSASRMYATHVARRRRLQPDCAQPSEHGTMQPAGGLGVLGPLRSMIQRADSLGWCRSVGVTAEINFARGLGLPIEFREFVPTTQSRQP
jgi:hypothetical protein